MNVNYPSIKAAMKNAGYPVSTGDGWNGKDAAAFRAFSQFVIGVDHSKAHVMTTMPLIYKDQLEAVGIEVPGSDGSPVVVEPTYENDADEFVRAEPVSNNALPDARADYSFEVTGAKPEAADDKQSDAAPATDAVEQAATPPKVAGAVESTGEGEKAAENAVLNQNDQETRDDLEQAEQDERDGDEAGDTDSDEGADDLGQDDSDGDEVGEDADDEEMA